MKIKKYQGFALLEVLLAVIVFAIATYGVIVFSSRYMQSTQVSAVERQATAISSNYLPYLDTTVPTGADTNDDPINDGKFAVSFLQSIGITDGDMSASSGNVYVNTHLPINGSSSSQMAGCHATVSPKSSTSSYVSSQSVLILGFNALGSQLNALIGDEKNNFAIYAPTGGEGSFADAKGNPVTQLIDPKYNNTPYSVYLVYPAVVDSTNVNFVGCDGFSAP